ncbi:TlpA family protein disulfide reductase [Lutibacter sp. B2]|nr:TlpA family protein disulfide reductase [Lutibacter sp. B2]
MKIFFLAILMAVAICTSIVGCGKSADNTANNQAKNEIQQTESKDEAAKGERNRYKEMGLVYYIPKELGAKQDAIQAVRPAVVFPGKYGVAYAVGQIAHEFFPTELGTNLEKKFQNAKTEEEQKEIIEEYKEEYKNKAINLFDIMVIDKSKEKNGPKEDIERKEKTFSKYKNHEKIAEKDNLEYYLLYNDEYDESKLSESEKKEFKEIREVAEKVRENIKKSIKVFTPVDSSEKMTTYKSIEFKTKTIDGKEIDSRIFKEHKLTMVNIWATFCGPCIGEMPEIQKLYEEVKKENVNIIGIVSDTPDDENEPLAKQILDKKGVKYDNIIADEKLKEGILKDVTGVPTTIFVDSKGNIVGEPIVGSRSKEEYKKAIDERVESLK